jgi:hypothetical protein
MVVGEFKGDFATFQNPFSRNWRLRGRITFEGFVDTVA